MSSELATTEAERLPESSDPEVKIEAVAELEGPIKKIIDKIKDRIESGEYGLIIGDDVSGRIPALILGKFIQKIYEARSFKKPNIIFIPGHIPTGNESSPSLEEHVRKWGLEAGQAVLIVTETIQTGSALNNLVTMLSKINHTVDIASIGVGNIDEDPDRSDVRDYRLREAEIFSGEYVKDDSNLPNTPSVYVEKSIGGVYKKRGDLKSKPFKNLAGNDAAKDGIQVKIGESRDDVSRVVTNLIDWYESRGAIE